MSNSSGNPGASIHPVAEGTILSWAERYPPGGDLLAQVFRILLSGAARADYNACNFG